MLSRLVLTSIRHRYLFAGLLAALLAVGAVAAKRLKIDAMPDVSTIQVDVITQAAGLSPLEVERTVTFPIENALNGVPRGVLVRSVSRFGLSAVTLVFEDGTDVWFARQMVLERLRQVQGQLPPAAETPELGPVSTGLGTIYRFVVKSEQHSAMQLRTLLDWEIVPKLRSVPGVIEVNTMGGQLKQYQVVVDRARLGAHGLGLEAVIEALRKANQNVGGGYVERRGESFTIRGQGLLKNEAEIGDVVVRAGPGGAALLVRHVADVRVDAALRYGVITHNGEGEAVTGIVMMLLGANSRDVVHAVKARMAEIEAALPAGVRVEVVYDRAEFVGRTLTTVAHNLLEGVLVVTAVLALMLGTLRGAFVAALGIPASMSVALVGMHAFGITGDLMSLGAIDFGFLVDGPVVILEAVMAVTAGRRLAAEARAREYGRAAERVASPVAVSVAIIMLVYVPLLALEGVEGKMFRPMALTMACALFGALAYTVLFFPALLALAVTPAGGHGPGWLASVEALYARLLPWAVRRRWELLGASGAALVATGWAFGGAGAEFVPRIFEGDAVVAMRRAPSIGLDEARKLDLAAEKVLLGFPEVEQALGQTGRAELAIDSVGNDNTDILAPLKPLAEWTSAADFDELSELIKDRIETEVPGTFVSVSQPIEDLTNQLISGSRADVSIKLFGPDLDELVRASNLVGERVGRIRGTGDLRIERVTGQPVITATADRARMARHGVTVEEAFHVLAAAREGVRVGDVYEQHRKFELRVLEPSAEPSAASIGDLFVTAAGGRNVPLHEVMALEEGDGPAVVRRENRERLLRIDVNLRGRDLLSWVGEAKRAVAADVPLKSGYRVEWGGQFENFERASARLAVVVPAVVGIILGMLFGMFKNARFALAVFAMVPFAATGGMLGLLARGLPFSLPAAVGFIALGGLSVLNGVVIANEVRRRRVEGASLADAIEGGALHSTRAVLTTGAVAALGFLPMALSQGAGAEVQRPLATVVIVGIGLSTALTLLLLPGALAVALRGWAPAPAGNVGPASDAGAPEPAPAE
ncbi:MAG TPA: CusA/CzcA family heavy metal efflux RND transporter [Polyangiaceae bacterium]|nr:CusA/CzcA family heavy metal efflux RND transporter [Polyangiaceae bacterium]